MADELRRYPLDVVTAALRAWPRQSRWRPTLAELVPLVDDALRWRRRVLADLRAVRDPEPPPPRPTGADIAEVEALVAAVRAGAAAQGPARPHQRHAPINLTQADRDAALARLAAHFGRSIDA